MLTKSTGDDRAMPRVNPFAIGLAILFGVVLFAVSLSGGQTLAGVAFLAIMWGFAAFLYFGARVSDTIALISDDVQDERNVHIHQRAALYTLNILAFIIVVAFIVDIARGGTGSPYTWLALTSAVVYLSLLVILSRRN